MKTCDSCGDSVRASWAAINDKAQTLHFCHHHKKQYALALMLQGWELADETEYTALKEMGLLQ